MNPRASLIFAPRNCCKFCNGSTGHADAMKANGLRSRFQPAGCYNRPMSRSRRHHPFCGIATSETEAWWKRLSSRALRCAFRVRMACGIDPDALVLPLRHEVKGQWGPKDGKQRFDVERHPELMRK